MKITSIPLAYRNMNRATEILSVLSKYGLADWISRLNLDFAKGIFKAPDGEALARHTREARIRIALTELGPTFIKLGQLLSTRPDIVGWPLADELSKLQASVPVDSTETIRRIIEEELGQPIDQLFSDFDDKAMASASIGQVHRATLPGGLAVVVKVQHAGIAEKIRKDIDVMSGLAQLADRIPEFEPYRPSATLAEFQRTLLRELDFGREERNLMHFADQFHDDSSVRIPRPISELCTPRVLTMEWLDGAKLSEVNPLAPGPFDLEKVARNGAEIYLKMIFVDGFYHADPHPGNIVLLPVNVIGLLDFGMVGRIDEELREDIEELMMAIVDQDPMHLCNVIMRVGRTPKELDESALRSDLADFVAHYASQSLDQFDLSSALREMTDMIYRYRIQMPPQVSMLLKTLITLEGTSKRLNPDFTIMEVMKPFQRRAILRRLSPTRRIRKIRRVYMELEHLAGVLPRRLMDILEQIQTGRFDVHLDHRGLGPSVNRLVLGMMVSALFLGSSLLLSRNVPPVIFQEPTILGMKDVSILGMSGCVLSFLVGLRLLRAIVKSGHLDHKE
ncbi:MAG: AarF/ABC1/UbiB kinase family protein [Planctomycetales bacterium]|nr:AarF/ABC1/UbiB kinase family protein [Planctomycetales bacterium]